VVPNPDKPKLKKKKNRIGSSGVLPTPNKPALCKKMLRHISEGLATLNEQKLKKKIFDSSGVGNPGRLKYTRKKLYSSEVSNSERTKK